MDYVRLHQKSISSRTSFSTFLLRFTFLEVTTSIFSWVNPEAMASIQLESAKRSRLHVRGMVSTEIKTEFI